MRIIISPAKQMRVDTDSFACTELPVFTDRAEILKDWIRSLSCEEQKTLLACNDKIARREQPDLIVLQSRNPSCGVKQRYDGTFSGTLVDGAGVTAQLLKENGFFSNFRKM